MVNTAQWKVARTAVPITGSAGLIRTALGNAVAITAGTEEIAASS